jgi:hypothetical protein
MFMKVDDPAMCTPTGFYLEGDKVKLCPDACNAIQGDSEATLAVDFTCEPLKPN